MYGFKRRKDNLKKELKGYFSKLEINENTKKEILLFELNMRKKFYISENKFFENLRCLFYSYILN